jgi:hypothetical protein
MWETEEQRVLRIKQTLWQLAREQEAIQGRLIEIREESDRLTRQLPPPPPPVKKWWRSDIMVACRRCGVKTTWRAPSGVAEHNAACPRQKGGITDSLWQMLLEAQEAQEEDFTRDLTGERVTLDDEDE